MSHCIHVINTNLGRACELKRAYLSECKCPDCPFYFDPKEKRNEEADGESFRSSNALLGLFFPAAL